ncbi:unnamed protein product, partial [Brassica oleracea var. botrytis]
KNSIFSTHFYNFVFQYLLFDLCFETVATEHETSGAEHGDVVDGLDSALTVVWALISVERFNGERR